MGGEFPKVPLGNVVQNFDSKRIPLSSRERAMRSGIYPYYGATGIIDHVDDYLFEGLYLLLAEDGSVETKDGYPFLQLVNGKFWVNNHAHVLRAVSDTDTKYLYYALSTIKIRPYMTGSVQPKLSQGNMNRIPVFFPEDAATRQAIAHILGTLDDKIELNRRMNQTLEEMARAIFKSWFVDYDPVRAKAAVRREHPDWSNAQVSRAACPTLKPEIAELFPDEFENSELGEIPKGWRVGRLGEVVENLRDQENPLSSPQTLYQHFSIPAFDEGQNPKAEFGEAIKSQKWRVPTGVVLLSKLNPEIERVWLADVRVGEPAVCSTEFLVLRARAPFTRSFVYCLTRSPLFRQHIEGLVTGTSKSHQRAQVDSILRLAVVVPPLSIIAAFDRSTDSLLPRTLECRRESHTLAALRDTLLPKLISGELRVKDAERIVGRAV